MKNNPTRKHPSSTRIHSQDPFQRHEGDGEKTKERQETKFLVEGRSEAWSHAHTRIKQRGLKIQTQVEAAIAVHGLSG